MGLTIEDGKGRGFTAAVNSEQELATRSVVVALTHHINEESGKVWSVPFEDLNPAGDDDYVVYIKNTGTKDLHVIGVEVSCDTAASQVEIHAVTGTSVGGSNITPVSRTVGSSSTPTATIESGTDITGLTTAGTLYLIQCAVADTAYSVEIESHIILPKGNAIGVLVKEGTANRSGVIGIMEVE